MSSPSRQSPLHNPSSTPSSTPSKARRPSTNRTRPRGISSASPLNDVPLTHEAALASVRTFLKGRSSYDVFPVSFRLIVLDTKLMVKKALGVMLQNGIISAPLWNSETSSFAGMLTVSDIVHLIQYYWHTLTYEEAAADVEHFRLENLHEIERQLHVPPPPTLSVHPLRPLFEASQLLQQTHARRLPLIDVDDQTGGEVVISVLTQYRVLKFISVNCPMTHALSRPLMECNIGTYVAAESDRPPGPVSPFWPMCTATLQTTVFDVVHMCSERGISAVPIVDENGVVVNLYETVDVITLVRLGAYTSLDLTISQALARRTLDFPGVVTCTPSDSLANLFQLIRKRRLHRLVVVDDGKAPGSVKGRLRGIISLSDVLKYVIGDEDQERSEREREAAARRDRERSGASARSVGAQRVPEVVIHHEDSEMGQEKGGGGMSNGHGNTTPSTTPPASPRASTYHTTNSPFELAPSM